MDIFVLNSLLIVSLAVFRLSARVHAPAAPALIRYFNLTQTVRTDLYAKMEMLTWIVTFIDKDMTVNESFCSEDAHACVKAPDRASHYANA